MRCGNCKSDHATVAEVKACYGGFLQPHRERVARENQGAFAFADVAVAAPAFAEAPRAESAPTIRHPRFPGRCARCGAYEPDVQTLSLQGTRGDYRLLHLDDACQERAPEPAPTTGYEPARGDVHVLDGVYVRVHVGQRSGKPYAVQAEVLEPAVWGDDGALATPGVIEWTYAPGLLKRLTEATRATPAQAAAFGHLVGRCCFCSTPIDTPESTTAGYGPKCAARYGLPWGKALEELRA